MLPANPPAPLPENPPVVVVQPLDPSRGDDPMMGQMAGLNGAASATPEVDQPPVSGSIPGDDDLGSLLSFALDYYS